MKNEAGRLKLLILAKVTFDKAFDLLKKAIIEVGH